MRFFTLRQSVLLTLAILVMTLSGVSRGAEPRQKPASQISPKALLEVQEQQEKIERMKTGIKEQKERIEESRQQEDSLIKELDTIEGRIKKDKHRLEELSEVVDAQEERILKKEAEYRKIQKDKDQARVHVEKRLAAYYRMDPLGVLNIVFSAETLPELLAVNDYLEAMVRTDRQAIAGYRDRMVNLAREKDSLNAEKERLLDMMNDVAKQENELVSTRKSRASLLIKVNKEKQTYQRALDEIEEAAARLTRKLEEFRFQEEQRALEAEKAAKAEAERERALAREAERTAKTEAEREKARAAERAAADQANRVKKQPAGPTGGSFAARKGSLPLPVNGNIVRRFGENRDNKFGITTFTSGIGIKAPIGSDVRAIHAGRVVYAGVLKGYGNLIVVDHGNQYYSLVARLDHFTRKEGESVQEGDTLGTVGEQAGLLDDGVYFEIRHGIKPEDPMLWTKK